MPGQPEVFTGGLLETNACLFQTPEGLLVFDAPDGLAAELRDRKEKVSLLVLTHGHFDHTWDAAPIARDHGCPVLYHQADEELCLNPDAAMKFVGMSGLVEPISATRFLKAGETLEHGGFSFQIFHIPGHSKGSLCFYEKKLGLVVGGDVLFAGGVGRWDLPGGSREDLIAGIRRDLMPLPDETVVYPGHGPETTIGRERRSNPYL